jgi:hypothetical protein
MHRYGQRENVNIQLCIVTVGGLSIGEFYNICFKVPRTCDCSADPPGTPNITGVTSETILEEGQVKRLTCIAMAGNPLADLKWFR